MQRIDADWLRDGATQRVFDLLREREVYAVGGCVRNTLFCEPVKDIDFATSATPDEVTRSADAAGLRAIPTGAAYGTVTVIVGDQPFEITTFRRDVETDGRRAVVAFAERIEDDARRRDFTVNAIYAAADGTLCDPVGGLVDIAVRRIRFIEDAEKRIREDYLRSLRFFRFSAWYADPLSGMDPDAIDAIARNLAGLDTLSRERVSAELLQLFAAPDPCFAVASMTSTEVLSRILPGSSNVALGPLIAIENTFGISPNPLRRLAVVGGAYDSLRLSRSQEKHIHLLREASHLSALEAGYKYGVVTGRDIRLVSAASTAQTVTNAELDDIALGASATFPVQAADLMPEFEKADLGRELERLEKRWIASRFTLSKQELLRRG